MQSGRETLENTIRMVEANPEWRARVVYGDTDSLFVLLPGRSRDEAFRIGAEIAAAATAANQPPVTLKMEKVRRWPKQTAAASGGGSRTARKLLCPIFEYTYRPYVPQYMHMCCIILMPCGHAACNGCGV